MTFFTERDGLLALSMRGARASKRRAGGALEPFHTLRLRYETQKEIGTLREAEIATVRMGLTANLDALGAAGTLARWLRHALPSHAPEPELFARTERALDSLNEPALDPQVSLVRFGMHLLGHMGYAFNVSRCGVCDRPRPVGKPAYLDVTRGGIICSQCGTHGTLAPASALDEAGTPEHLSFDTARFLLARVQEAIAHHTGMKGT
jgi:DNA repair protein RecO (recombination protein O)